ncbi:MAG TPA: hypothetical protein VK009_15575 [Chloroflexota bacterium]|nr:hypothetical protein [Chloroflexota bacterium]
MATRKIPISVDEDLLREYKRTTRNLSAPLVEPTERWLALQRQNDALAEFENETGNKADADELQRARQLLRGWQQRHSR